MKCRKGDIYVMANVDLSLDALCLAVCTGMITTLGEIIVCGASHGWPFGDGGWMLGTQKTPKNEGLDHLRFDNSEFFPN